MSFDWGKSMRAGVVWSALAYAASRGFTLIATVILARLLVPAQFGLVAAVTVFLSLMELASDLGMGATVIYEQEQGLTRRVDSAFTTNLIVAVILCGAGVAAAPLVAKLFQVSGHADLFRLGALSLLLTSLGNIHDSLLLRELAFNRRIVPQVVRTAVRGAVSILLAALGLGAVSLVIGMLAGSAAWTVTLWVITGYRPRPLLDWAVARSMAAYGSAATVLEALGVIGSRIDQVVISRVLGTTALGLYSIAFRIPEAAIDSVSWTVSVVAFPALSRHREADAEGLGRATLSVVRYQALYSLPVAVALAIVASPLVIVLFGVRWAGAGPVMSAVCLMSGITGVVFPLGDVFKALGRQRTMIALNLGQWPLFISVILVVAHYGIAAVAWGRVGTMALTGIVMMVFITRAVSIRLGDVATALRPSLVAAGGLACGGLAVRLAWPAHSIGALATAVAAELVCGLVALRTLAPGTLTDVRRLLPSFGRGASAAPAGS